MGLIVNDITDLVSTGVKDDRLVHICPRWNPDRAFCGKDMTGTDFIPNSALDEICVVCRDMERP